MRPLVLFAIGLLCTGAAACGGSGKSTGSALPASSNAATTTDATTATAAAKGASRTAQTHPPSVATVRHYVGEPHLSAAVAREVGRVLATYGHPASATVTREVTALVKRYYAIASAKDGKRACAMLAADIAKRVPLDYGWRGGKRVRGATTCPAALTHLFKFQYYELSVPVIVTGVLVKGEDAYALMASSRMVGSFIALKREHGAWIVDQALGGTVAVLHCCAY